MIKFLRRIRQQLLSENKFSKYILYAIGEIILVVIGILIALSINNWNEQRKSNKLEAEYYCRLLEDTQQDLEQVEAFINLSKDRLAASNQAVRLLKKEKTKKTAIGKEIGTSIRAIYSDFSPNNSAFEDLKSGANLNIIKDKTIIKAINNYFNKVQGYLSVIKVNSDNALDKYFSYRDRFESGHIHASMFTDRFIIGMEKDVYESMQLDYEETLSESMKYQLLNDAIIYLSANSRHLELYDDIKEEVNNLIAVLEPKCIKQ